MKRAVIALLALSLAGCARSQPDVECHRRSDGWPGIGEFWANDDSELSAPARIIYLDRNDFRVVERYDGDVWACTRRAVK